MHSILPPNSGILIFNKFYAITQSTVIIKKEGNNFFALFRINPLQCYSSFNMYCFTKP